MKNSNQMGRMAVSLVSIISASACGLIKDMGEMHDSTQSMATTTAEMSKEIKDTNQNTQELKELTKDLKKLSSNMNHTSSDLYDVGTSGGASDQRRNAMSVLKPKHSRSISAKLPDATTLMDSFEYGFWRPDQDTIDLRETLMVDAIKDFFRKVQPLIKSRDNLSPINLYSPKSRSLYAIVASMHYYHHLQDKNLKGTNFPILSIYDIIANALKKQFLYKQNLISRDEITLSERQVLVQEQDAIYLLKLRHKFLDAFAYSLLDQKANGDDQNLVHDMLLIAKSGLFGQYWESNSADRNVFQIEYIRDVLRRSIAVKNLLLDIGQNPFDGNNTVTQLLAHLTEIKQADSLETEISRLQADPGHSAYDLDLRKAMLSLVETLKEDLR